MRDFCWASAAIIMLMPGIWMVLKIGMIYVLIIAIMLNDRSCIFYFLLISRWHYWMSVQNATVRMSIQAIVVIWSNGWIKYEHWIHYGFIATTAVKKFIYCHHTVMVSIHFLHWNFFVCFVAHLFWSRWFHRWAFPVVIRSDIYYVCCTVLLQNSIEFFYTPTISCVCIWRVRMDEIDEKREKKRKINFLHRLNEFSEIFRRGK